MVKIVFLVEHKLDADRQSIDAASDLRRESLDLIEPCGILLGRHDESGLRHFFETLVDTPDVLRSEVVMVAERERYDVLAQRLQILDHLLW